MTERGRLTEWTDIQRFVLAGNATFTLLSVRTQQRFTYKVTAQEDDNKPTGRYYVSLLAGPENTSDYAYMGMLEPEPYHLRRSKASRMTGEAPSWKALTWFLARMQAAGEPSETMEFWHEGRCCRCGRKLTVPDSVAAGIGPECATRMAA